MKNTSLPNFDQLLPQVIAIAKAVGAFIASEGKNVSTIQIDEKSRNQLVSYVDKTAEKMIIDGLKPLLPDAAFLCEEETEKLEQKEWTWIIDPLDGTTNFLHQLPSFCVSIGLFNKETGYLGVVYDIPHDVVYAARKGGGATANGLPIHVSDTADLKDALFGTGFPYTDFSWSDNYLQFLKYLMQNTRGIRRFGAAALDLCWLACGKYDAFYEQSLAPWDVAAGIVIVQEAGGKIQDFAGGDNYLHGRQIVAANPLIFDKSLAALQKFV